MTEQEIETFLKRYPDVMKFPSIMGGSFEYKIKDKLREGLEKNHIPWSFSIFTDNFISQELIKLGIIERGPLPEKLRQMDEDERARKTNWPS